MGCWCAPPLGMRTWGAIRLWKRGISAILPRYHMKTRQKACDTPSAMLGITERGVPQAYVRARASSATLCSVHVPGSFAVFSTSKRESDTYQNGLGYISDTYPNRYPPSHGTPLMIVLRCYLEKVLRKRRGNPRAGPLSLSKLGYESECKRKSLRSRTSSYL